MVGVSSGRGPGPLGTLFACGSLGGRTDAELLNLFAGGEAAEAAFEALVHRHGPAVLRACRRVLSDPNDADDAFQATFLVLARRAASGSIGQPESLGPWLHGVALRVARKARVAAARRRRHEGCVARPPDASPAQPNHLAAAIRDEVDRLPEPLRTPVVLCYLEDMTYRGAARSLRVSEATIRGRLVKARDLLRCRLGRNEDRAVTRRADGAARVPPPLAVATVGSAMTFAPGGAGMTGVPAAVAELMEGVLMMTSVTRWIVGALSLATICLASGGGAVPTSKGDDEPSAGKAVAAKRDPRKVDVRRDDSPDPSPARVLTLDDAIGLLLRGSVDLRQGFVEVTMARADVLAAPFRDRPRPDAALLFLRTGGYSDFHPAGAAQYDLNISYPVDYSLKRRVRTIPAGAATSVAEAQYQDLVRNRIDNLCAMYVDVQEAQERVRRAEAKRHTWETLSPEAEERKRLTPDIKRIEGLRLIEARAGSARARISLSFALNLPVQESDRLEVEALAFPDPDIRAPDVESLIGLALQMRPDLAALRLGVARAEADLEDARRRPPPRANGDPSGAVQRAEVNHQQSQLQLARQERAIIEEIKERRSACEAVRVKFEENLSDLIRRRQTLWEAKQQHRSGVGKYEDLAKARREIEVAEAAIFDKNARHRRSMLALNAAVGLRLFP